MENGNLIKFGELVEIDRKCRYIDLKSNDEVSRYYVQDYLIDPQSEEEVHIQFYRVAPLEYEGLYVKVYLDEDSKFYSVVRVTSLASKTKNFSNLIENTDELNEISLIRKTSEKDDMALKRLVKKKIPSAEVENVVSSSEKTVESSDDQNVLDSREETLEEKSSSVQDVEENVKSSSRFVFKHAKVKKAAEPEKETFEQSEIEELKSADTHIDDVEEEIDIYREDPKTTNSESERVNVKETSTESVDKHKSTTTEVLSEKNLKHFTQEEKNDILYSSQSDEATVERRKWCIEKTLEVKFVDSPDQFVELCRKLEEYLKHG